ncbi:hypothetical protein AWW67_13320 [Roseivirga seohaensis]|uniref:Uncharacterized protein n=1 Tax=Roseivirga seohaensis TaxID=1914963 RepID=A0A150XKT7_9BACT|nr:hypothetical protein [Roseivirga seohaensis]KYG79349.1 hypothetical protein AWW67_13320 [Roseivirga seohaensis]
MEPDMNLTEYINCLELELSKAYPRKKQADIATSLGFGLTTYHKIFGKKQVSSSTLDDIAKKISFVTYEQFIARRPLLLAFEEHLLDESNSWKSYCFNKRRRMYESNWTFKKRKRRCDEKNENCEEYIEVTRETIDYHYKGEMVINPDLTISISIRTNPDFRVNYFTKLPEVKHSDFFDNLNFLILEASAVRRKETFTTMELLVRSDKAIKPRVIEYENIHPISNEKGIPQNQSYLAFNYLTRNVSKSRRNIDNYDINIQNELGGFLNYTHQIFISCPIGFITKREQFDQLKFTIDQIIEVLISNFRFTRDNIFCEIAKYKTFDDIRVDDRFVFFETRKFIKATHFISVLPEALLNHNSGAYMEIYFRILKKMPAIVFVENRKILPSLLQGLLDNPDRPINFAVKDIELKEIPSYMKSATQYLFSFSL